MGQWSEIDENKVKIEAVTGGSARRRRSTLTRPEGFGGVGVGGEDASAGAGAGAGAGKETAELQHGRGGISIEGLGLSPRETREMEMALNYT